MSKPENPSAFPAGEQYSTFNQMAGTTEKWVKKPTQKGMTLRDWFAGQVAGHVFQQIITTGSDYEPYMVASDAYKIADAMLQAREVGNEANH